MSDLSATVIIIEKSIDHLRKQANSGITGPYPTDFTRIFLRNINELSFEVRNKNNKLYLDLQSIRENLFYGANFVNLFSLGRLTQILSLYNFKEENQDVWRYIHPIITDISKKKFDDGHYNDAVRTSIIEICAIVRKYRKMNGYDEIISDVNMLRNTFKKESNILSFTDCSDETEKNIQKGYENLFAGTMEAIRNLSAHDNANMSEVDAARKLILASDLMYMLDKALERASSYGGE